ncbi:MAG: ATP-grasp domain-containing protein [Treponema sp.]|jgi:biotin carboxylase|nr:ATP-grasp domain-containing protein [Treponema sp.]
MKERLIILGAGVMQGPAIRIAKELGFHTIVLDGSAQAPCIPMADQFEQIDLKDKEGIETFARSLRGKLRCKRQNSGCPLGIMTAGTDFSASVAWVAEKLNLPGIPYEAALNASDKSRMRSCFKKARLPSPEFTIITAADLYFLSSPQRVRSPKGELLLSNTAASSCAGTYYINSSTPLDGALARFPLVIKPVDNMGSRGCRRIDNINELQEAAKTALHFSRSGRAIVEAFMDGPEFSVDAIVYNGEITICGLADRHIFFPPYFIEMGHTMPTVIEKEKQEAMLETFCEGVRALGLAGEGSIGAAKGDIKLTANGPMIGEIAARLSGGYMSGWTYPYASGVQPIRAAILAAMGRKPDGLVPTKTQVCAERAFISIPGTVKTISCIEQAQNQPHVKDLFLRIAEGGKVSFPENNVTKCGNIIAAAGDRAAAINAAEAAARSILIRLEPGDNETAAFLHPLPTPHSHNSLFPPDAFQLTEELKTALSQIPETQPPKSSNSGLSIVPFPAFTTSGLRDYMGRTIEDTMQAVCLLSGFPLTETPENAENKAILGRSFWTAFIRGSYQGAVYYIDNLGIK